MLEKQGYYLILSVDDDLDILDLVAKILKDEGYNVFTVNRPSKALGFLANIQPDLILLDVNMPEMDGFELCHKIVNLKKDHYIPVIFLTSLDAEQDKSKAFAAGGVDFINKSMIYDKLASTVKKHIKTKQRWSKVKILEKATKSPPSLKADLKGFKDYLSNLYHFPSLQRKQLFKSSYQALYPLANFLGISQAQMAKNIADFLRIPYREKINADDLELGVFPTAFCRNNDIVALKVEDEIVCVLSNPFNLGLIQSLDNFLPPNHNWKFVITEPDNLSILLNWHEMDIKRRADEERMDNIQKKLIHHYEAKPIEMPISEDSDEHSEPIIAFVNQIIEEGYRKKASDVHIEPWEEEVVVRYRVDGFLSIAKKIRPQSLIRPISARIKIMSKLNIAERRRPQDGRIVFKKFSRQKNQDFDLRVSISPMNFGEKVVLRIIEKKAQLLNLERIGFSSGNLNLYRKKIRSPHGMILHVGPTGSGKSMSLYAALNELKSPTVNIQTAEDPIEYTLQGINQMQMNPEIGVTFSNTLRSFLRQDPDIILVGEIRDLETAKMAIEASLTGHLIFSTLHTNDASSTIARLLEMGIEPYLITSSIIAICAQRLLRRLCPKCKREHFPSYDEKQLLGLDTNSEENIFIPNGCSQCQSGYKGRIGVHELLIPNDILRHAISQKKIAASELIKEIAIQHCNMKTLYQDAVEKVLHGYCSLDEVLSKIQKDKDDVYQEAGAMTIAFSNNPNAWSDQMLSMKMQPKAIKQIPAKVQEKTRKVVPESLDANQTQNVDLRISNYIRAIYNIIQERFPIKISFQGIGDEIDELGEALCELAETLEKRFSQIEKLNKIREKINAGTILDDVLNHVYTSFRSLIPYNRIGFALLEEEGKILRARWARSDACEPKIKIGYFASMEGSSLQKIIDTGEPRILNDLEAYLEKHPNSESTRLIVEEGMKSSLTCPLTVKKTVGFMFFSSTQAQTYEKIHVKLFLQIAGELSIIIRKSRLYQKLMEMNELKNRFLGMAAHDLRSPLNLIKGYLNLLIDKKIESEEEREKILKTLQKSSQNMLTLINDLLDISAIEAGGLELNPEPTDIAKFMAQCQENNQFLAQEKAIDIQLELAKDIPIIDMIPKSMEQVMNNLLSNAIKYSETGTTVKIRVEVKGKNLLVFVEDQGLGIPEDELPKLFLDFSRTSVMPTGGEKSTGLGLFIVKRIIDAHQGKIWVKSEVGVGTTFSFSIPTERSTVKHKKFTIL